MAPVRRAGLRIGLMNKKPTWTQRVGTRVAPELPARLEKFDVRYTQVVERPLLRERAPELWR